MEFSQDEVVEAIDRLVGGLLERAGALKPPVDALAIAEQHLGIPVEVVELAEEDERGRRRPRSHPAGSGIMLSPDMTIAQQQKVAANGIAEALLPEILHRLRVPRDSDSKALSAHLRGLIVSRLLIPTRLLRIALKTCRYDVPALAQAFSTATIEAVALRLLDLDEPCVIAIVDDGVVAQRRSNRFSASKKLEPAEQQCLDRVMEWDRPERVRSGEWTVNGWPVPDRPFRRIILRAVPDDV